MPAQKITKEKRCCDKISGRIREKGLTQAKFAKLLGDPKGQSKVSIWLKDIYNVKPYVILEMSDVLGIDIFDIMTKYWKEEKA